MEKGNYKITTAYPGGYNQLDPEYGSIFTGYRTGGDTLGMSLDPRTANILKEFSDKLASGQKTVELSMIMPETVDTIPKHHLNEIRQLSKLTGVDVTVHGPLIEASGLSKEGFSEANREAAERQMIQAVGRAHEASPEGNVPVTFHSSAMLPPTEYSSGKEGEKIEKTFAIDQATGQIMPVKREEKFYPRLKGEEQKEIVKKIRTPGEQIVDINNTSWSNSLTELIPHFERSQHMIEETLPIAMNVLQKQQEGIEEFTQAEIAAKQRFQGGMDQLSDTYAHLATLFDKAYQYGSEEEKIRLHSYVQELEKVSPGDPLAFSRGLQEFRENLTKVNPELFQSLNDYSMDKTSETFGNVAYESYKKFKQNAPIISIENPPAGMNAFSRGKDLKEISENSREQFVKRATTDGMSESQAKIEAEKLIGVTWDVGHINQLKKFGYTDEDLVEESKRVAPYLKHVHLSDNFGMENTELPMGMGNVPLKEMMEALGKKGEKAKKIVEAGNWWQHFQTSPMALSYEAMGSPIYSMKMAPYWNQTPTLQEGYFSGLGPTLPQINYATFGGGFSQLPPELGGQTQATGRGRMSGTPME